MQTLRRIDASLCPGAGRVGAVGSAPQRPACNSGWHLARQAGGIPGLRRRPRTLSLLVAAVRMVASGQSLLDPQAVGQVMQWMRERAQAAAFAARVFSGDRGERPL